MPYRGGMWDKPWHVDSERGDGLVLSRVLSVGSSVVHSARTSNCFKDPVHGQFRLGELCVGGLLPDFLRRLLV